jgi:hypothetical protein
MILEVAAHEVVAVADTAGDLRVVAEEQPRRFDPAHAQDHLGGFDPELFEPLVLGDQVRDALRVAGDRDLRHVGVEEDLDVLRLLERRDVTLTQVGVGRPFREVVVQAIGVERVRHTEQPTRVRVEVEVVASGELEGPLVEWSELLRPDGPSAVVDPRARGEVEGLEWQQLTTPTRGGASEHALAPHHGAVEAEATGLAAIQVLHLALQVHGAALEHDHRAVRLQEHRGERKARGARSHDADIAGVRPW